MEYSEKQIEDFNVRYNLLKDCGDEKKLTEFINTNRYIIAYLMLQPSRKSLNGKAE